MKKIKILYDAHILRDGLLHQNERRGIYWVAYNLLKYFTSNPSYDVTLYLNTCIRSDVLKNDDFFKTCKIIFRNYQLGKAGGKKSFLNKNFNLYNYDCYFNVDHRTGLEDYSSFPKFYILHDTIPLLYDIYGKGFRDAFFKFYSTLPDSIKYFCVSYNTKNDFIKHFKNMKPENMKVTYISTAQDFHPDYNCKNLSKVLNKFNIKDKIEKKYIFYLCGLGDKRKNLVHTIKGFIKFIEKYNIKDLYFFLGGSGQETLKERLKNELGYLYERNKDKIITLGYIEDEDVNILLSNSLFFVCLSLYEGFGMPNLEAMQAGVPIISSNTSSIPEVVGDCGILINPKSEDEYIKALYKMYYDENFRQTCRQRGLGRAKLFTWDNTYKIIDQTILDTLTGENCNA